MDGIDWRWLGVRSGRAEVVLRHGPAMSRVGEVAWQRIDWLYLVGLRRCVRHVEVVAGLCQVRVRGTRVRRAVARYWCSIDGGWFGDRSPTGLEWGGLLRMSWRAQFAGASTQALQSAVLWCGHGPR